MNPLKLTLLIVFIAWCIFMNYGCAQNKSQEALTVIVKPTDPSVESVTFTWESEALQSLFLYYTNAKQVEHITPFTSLVVGKLESFPDSDSIEATGGLAGEIIRQIITK